MGKIKKILENELVGGTQTTDVYPVTSTKAVYDENNERLDNILGGLRDKIGILKNAGYLYAGIATPTTNPSTPEGPVFYITNGKGTYTNFGGINVTEDEVVVLYYDTSWHKDATGIASNDKLTKLDTQINGEEARVIDDFSQLTLTNAAIIRNWSTYEGATSWLIEVEPGTNISIDTTGVTNGCFLSFLKTNDVVIGQAPNIINGFATFVTSLRTEKGIPLTLDSTRCAMGKNDVLNMVAPADMNYLYVQNLANRIPHSITIGEATSGLVDKLNEIDDRNSKRISVLETSVVRIDDNLKSVEDKVNENSGILSDIIKITETSELVYQIISKVEALVFDEEGKSQAIYINGGDDIKLEFDEAVYTGTGVSTSSLYEFDKNGNVISSIIATDIDGVLYTSKASSQSFTRLTKSFFPEGGYYEFTANKETAYIKIAAFVNPHGTPMSDRMPIKWTFSKKVASKIVGVNPKAIINGGLTISDISPVVDKSLLELEQGSIVFNTGLNIDSPSYIRTKNFIKANDFLYVISSFRFVGRVFWYDNEQKYKGYYDTFESIFAIPENADGYFRVSLKGTTSITPADETVFNLIPKYDRESLMARYISDAYLLKNLYAQKDYKFMDVTDVHGKFESVELGGIMARICGKDITYISTGDFVNLNPRHNGVDDEDIEKYMTLAKKFNIYHCLGQHEVGFQNLDVGIDGKLITETLTHNEAFDKFIEPMIDSWGLVEADVMREKKQIWYYKDIYSKIRLISLYQFNVPLEIDPNDSTRYKYIRCSCWYGEEQMRWLANVLNTTPDGYKIIVLCHMVDGKTTNCNNNLGIGYVEGRNRIQDENPLAEMIDAYMKRTTINKTYRGQYSYDASHDNSDYTQLSMTVNADFTNAKGDFLGYYAGDVHKDCIGVTMEDYPNQKANVVTSPQSPYDLKLGVGNKSTFVTGFAYNNGFTMLYVARVGVDTSYYMQDRSKGVITL